MARTYVVEDKLRNLRLALKVLRLGSEVLLGAFRDEFARLSGLVHPHLSIVHDFGTGMHDGERFHFYTADLIEGVTLDQYTDQHGGVASVEPLAHAIKALGFLHRLGLRHGDFKPQNILVTPDGTGILTDLGCSSPLGSEPDGTLWGTREFMAPELLEGQKADLRADLYSVGVTLQKLHLQPEEVSDDVISLASRLTASDPAARPTETTEVLEALGVTSLEPGPPIGRAARLVGRLAELRLFQRFLESLEAGEPAPRALIVHGPSGIGRSRLLQEIKWRAQLRVSVVEGLQTTFASPFVAMLSHSLGETFSNDLAGVLRARNRLSEGGEPVVYILDDALDRTADQALVNAFLRTLDTTFPAFFVFSGSKAPEGSESMALRVVELPPLTEAEVGRWVGDMMSPRYLPHLWRLTQGNPALVGAALAKLEAGELHEDDLGLESMAAPFSIGVHVDLTALSLEEKRHLGLLALVEGWGEELIDSLELDEGTLRHLHHLGWIHLERSCWRLARSTDAAQILEALEGGDSELLRSLHAALTTPLFAMHQAGTSRARTDGSWQSQVMGRLTHHVACSGDSDEAERFFTENASLVKSFPEHWRGAADSLAHRSPSIEPLLLIAEVHQLSGHPERGLAILLELLDSSHHESLPTLTHVRCRQQLAACLVKLGEPEQAIEHLRDALELKTDDKTETTTVDLFCRTLIQQGRYREAFELSEEGLSSAGDPELVALLHENMGVSMSYLGNLSSAREHLREAEQHQALANRPRARVRVLSYQGIVEFRAGDVEASIDRHRLALEIAETKGLLDLVASTALNLGTAYQQQGNWGPALSSYERGLQIATALGKRSTEISLRFNVANLHGAVGLFERAKIGARSLRGVARDAGLDYFVGWTAALLGEIAMHQGAFVEAKEWLHRAKETFVALDAMRELTEIDLFFVEVSLLSGDLKNAAEHLGEVRESLTAQDAADLDAWARMLSGKLLIGQGNGAEAIMALEDAARRGRLVGQPVREAEIELLLSESFKKQGSSELAERHRRRAKERWERISASLPEQLRDAFWAHPSRALLDHSPLEKTRLEKGDVDTLNLRKFFEVNKRINSTLSVKKVLEYALDSAIELAGAERGLILLADKDRSGKRERFKVRVARNLDREQLGRSHLKFSRSIAEAVIATDTPILTADAQGDDRFGDAESIHAMQLKSVACVPIRALSTVLGALYVDNRFHQGRFGDADIDLLMAFSDQVALALQNARLHGKLERQTVELQAKQRQVERLMQGQAEEIDRLQAEVRAKQEVLEYRYDYSNIIGRSAAMGVVFATLDRVIDSSLSVLIHGESGTGKELCARAVHFNGPRRERPFVTLNCAALPDTLLESELFGHVRGAFTGADRDREGLLVAARGGSLLLDEVGEMSLVMQAKLLRTLEERKIRPLGSSELIPLDIRTIFATNRRLVDEVEAGRFRHDLYYRIAVVELSLPPLRERTDDIPELAGFLLEKLAEKAGQHPAPRLSRDVLRLLTKFPWPGNVRQLENVLAKTLIMVTGEEVTPGDIELPDVFPSSGRALDRKAYEAEEERRILAALTATRWNISEVSRRLDIPRNTLYRKLDRYKIKRS